MRRIVILHQVDESVQVNVFTCDYNQVGDYSLSWEGQLLCLTMRNGRDEQGSRIYAKIFLKAWEVTVSEAIDD
jgi:hypothetical protein